MTDPAALDSIAGSLQRLCDLIEQRDVIKHAAIVAGVDASTPAHDKSITERVAEMMARRFVQHRRTGKTAFQTAHVERMGIGELDVVVLLALDAGESTTIDGITYERVA